MIAPSMRESESILYHRIGGYDVIAGVVDDLFERIHKDPRFARFGMGRSIVISFRNRWTLDRTNHFYDGKQSATDKPGQ
jgi:hypothetical protein